MMTTALQSKLSLVVTFVLIFISDTQCKVSEADLSPFHTIIDYIPVVHFGFLDLPLLRIHNSSIRSMTEKTVHKDPAHYHVFVEYLQDYYFIGNQRILNANTHDTNLVAAMKLYFNVQFMNQLRLYNVSIDTLPDIKGNDTLATELRNLELLLLSLDGTAKSDFHIDKQLLETSTTTTTTTTTTSTTSSTTTRRVKGKAPSDETYPDLLEDRLRDGNAKPGPLQRAQFLAGNPILNRHFFNVKKLTTTTTPAPLVTSMATNTQDPVLEHYADISKPEVYVLILFLFIILLLLPCVYCMVPKKHRKRAKKYLKKKFKRLTDQKEDDIEFQNLVETTSVTSTAFATEDTEKEYAASRRKRNMRRPQSKVNRKRLKARFPMNELTVQKCRDLFKERKNMLHNAANKLFRNASVSRIPSTRILTSEEEAIYERYRGKPVIDLTYPDPNQDGSSDSSENEVLISDEASPLEIPRLLQENIKAYRSRSMPSAMASRLSDKMRK